jgi:hypothetical protein
MIVAAVSAPKNVMCIEINVSDYGEGMTGYGSTTSYTDVTPGSTTTIQVGPLSPGYVELWGDAYDVPCSTIEYGIIYGSSSGPIPVGVGSSGAVADATAFSDGGVVNPTWEADYTEVLVSPGAPTVATLSFHQLGSLNLGVDFQNCDPNSDEYQPWCYDAGGVAEDGGVVPPGSGSGSSSGVLIR